MKTVRELAEELDVSKTTIRNHLKNLPENLSVSKSGNLLQLDTDVEAFIKDKVQRVSDNFAQKGLQKEHILSEKIEMLKERNKEIVSDNEYLRDQLKEKNNQIENLTRLLDHQQQLQLRSTQELDRIKQEKVELIEIQEQSEENKGFWARLLGK
ncbi:HTH domain-containing protein [Staphylococcus haemolyticus]|jgi:predicted ArsR family transcriptional regulator|uniref:HTH domain-containing protein n=1 Tax=Staphylococcus haemolyticus TaxID=1283 RepID=UPI001642AAE1|nr:HTH domain-containing protein [Staphylococcus haemolyticus]MBC3106293.1 HTH domain-containing protein [Staphylococcus haemolyticus]